MKRFTLLLLLIPFSAVLVKAQPQQFAVVRPDGTTYICPTFDSANTKAVDDDIIYMPGVTITGDKTISKRLTLIGTGHYPDSTIYTGKTIFTGKMFLEKKCWLEGFEVQNIISITSSIADSCSFIRINCLNVLYLAGTNAHIIDGSAIWWIQGYQYNVGGCPISSNLLLKNSIISKINRIKSSSVSNCLLNGNDQTTTQLETQDVVFTNCLFYGFFSLGWVGSCGIAITGNSSNNCIWYQNINIPGQFNYINNQPDTIMINAPAPGFGYTYNYHLKPNSPYLTAGDDGLQIGIYGGQGPYKEGAVPSNPHIYFKQVSNQTNNNGQLPVQFKVRTNNY
jgi:hypothetical protein